MFNNFRKAAILFFIFGGLSLSFGFGFYFGKLQTPPAPIQGIANQEIGKPQDIDFSLFWDAWREIEKKYVSRQDLDLQKMVYGAIAGMVKSLNDPYTVFFEPEENKKFLEDVKGSFEGIGAEIGIKKEQLLIIAPLEDSPAKKAGLMPGDQIVKIDGKAANDLTIEEAVNSIRGPKGTEVTLNIFRKEWQEPKDIKIKRDIIKVPSLKWELKERDIVYIKLYQFSEKASFDFRQAVSEILKTPAKKIILDLRGNPGGYLEVSRDIASWFLEKDKIVVIEDFGDGRGKKEYKAAGNPKFLDWPMVVLVNQGSASASEILAGSLRDNLGTKLIGEKTFGKGSVQELDDLKNGSSLKITVAKWFTPKGISISDQGLEPDIKIEMTAKDIEENKDPQLDKAIEMMKGLK